jgi:hypothetical protein
MAEARQRLIPSSISTSAPSCWGLMRDALHAGMEIPDDRQLRDDLIGPEYGFTASNQIQFEKKGGHEKARPCSRRTVAMPLQ